MGKPKLTMELAEKAIELVSTGASNVDVIAWLGVSDQSFYRWIREPRTKAEARLSEGIKKAEADRKMWHIRRINEAARNGDWKASAWYLERRYPNEYARTQRVMGTIETQSKPDALTQAILETAKKMEENGSE